MTKNAEFRDDLPTLLNSRQSKENIENLLSTEFEREQKASVCSVFNKPKQLEVEVFILYLMVRM